MDRSAPCRSDWVSDAFYTALIWVNLLLGHMLTPLFLLPLTWVQDAMANRKPSSSRNGNGESGIGGA